MHLALPPLCGCIWRRSRGFGSPDRFCRVQRRYLGTIRGKRLRGLVSAVWKRLVDLARHVPGPPFRTSRSCSFESGKALERLVYPGAARGRRDQSAEGLSVPALRDVYGSGLVAARSQSSSRNRLKTGLFSVELSNFQVLCLGCNQRKGRATDVAVDRRVYSDAAPRPVKTGHLIA